ncbi:MAG TPA: hypothetical protein VFG23_26650 [Polyangia bacterium]|nr:hypothetical protein [Polyangia bacterium]
MMVVEINKSEGGFSGAFQVRDEQSASNRREVHGPTCAEVADAMAVVTAIALRPEVAEAEASTVDSASPVSPATASHAAAPSAQRPVVERLRGNTEMLPARTENVEVEAGTLRFDLERSVTFYAGAGVGLVPSVVLPRYEISSTTAHFVTTPDGAQKIVGLVFQLHVSVFGPATYRSPDTTTDLVGMSFGMGLCQAPIYDTRALVLLFCGQYGGGFMNLVTKGADGSQLQSKNAGFGTVSFDTEIQYNLGSIFHVGAKIGGGLNVGQVTAERADGSRIFGSSTWAAYALLGIGLQF